MECNDDQRMADYSIANQRVHVLQINKARVDFFGSGAIKSWFFDLPGASCKIRIAKISLQGWVGVRLSEKAPRLCDVSSFFSQFSHCCIQRFSVGVIDATAWYFQRQLFDSMPVLLDHHNRVLRSNGDDVDPGAAIKGVKIA